MAGANLLHFDAYAEHLGQYLDELAEIDTFVGNIVEDCLVSITLILHVANLHLQLQVQCNLSGPYHGAMFAAFGLFILLHIYRFGFAVDAFDIGLRFQVCFLQLDGHQAAGQRYHADVMTRRGLHGHDVALLQRQMVTVVIVPFTGVFKLHLHQVGLLVVARDVGQPVVGIQLVILSAAAFAAEATASIMYLKLCHNSKCSVEVFLMVVIIGLMRYCFKSTIIFSEKSKKTMRALTFCSMCRCASLSSSIIPITLRSLMKGAKRTANCCSGVVM